MSSPSSYPFCPEHIGATLSDVPPLSAALADAVRAPRRVRTRNPWLALMVAVALTLLWPLQILRQFGVRRDWTFLPPFFAWGFAGLWLLAAILLFKSAFIPARHQVLPDTFKAGRFALGAALLLMVSNWLLPGIAPGHTLLSPTDTKGFWSQWWGCTFFCLQIAVSAFVVGAFLLRKVVPLRRSWLGAGLGGAGGALGGFALHLLCPVGDAAHVALAHGGGMLLGLLIGAVLLPLTLAVALREGRLSSRLSRRVG